MAVHMYIHVHVYAVHVHVCVHVFPLARGPPTCACTYECVYTCSSGAGSESSGQGDVQERLSCHEQTRAVELGRRSEPHTGTGEGTGYPPLPGVRSPMSLQKYHVCISLPFYIPDSDFIVYRRHSFCVYTCTSSMPFILRGWNHRFTVHSSFWRNCWWRYAHVHCLLTVLNIAYTTCISLSISPSLPTHTRVHTLDCCLLYFSLNLPLSPPTHILYTHLVAVCCRK